jgi:coenzyme PQQ precursor peptide PqqA
VPISPELTTKIAVAAHHGGTSVGGKRHRAVRQGVFGGPESPLSRGSEPNYPMVRCLDALGARIKQKHTTMAWTTPTLVEICIGLEINGYLPAEF